MRSLLIHVFHLVVLLAHPAASETADGPTVGLFAPEGDTVVLTSISQIRHLTRKDAEKRMPIQLRVTVLSATNGGMFVHDGEYGIWVDFGEARSTNSMRPESVPVSDLRRGVLVEMVGVTDPGGYAPQVIPSMIRIVGPGTVPAPKDCGMERLLSGNEDCQWVALEGVIQNVHDLSAKNRLTLILAVDGQCCRLEVQDPQGMAPAILVDARVRVQGVFSAKTNLRGELAGLQMFVGGAGDIAILTPAREDPFSAPRVSLRNLLAFSPSIAPNHRKVTQGTVTFVFPGRFFFLQDGFEGARIEFTGMSVHEAEKIEVAGFVTRSQSLAGISGAVVRSLGESTLPAPKATTTKLILRPPLLSPWTGQATEDANGLRVRLKGNLLKAEPLPSEGLTVLRIESEGETFPAFLPDSDSYASLLRWVPGSEVELTGVCELDLGTPVMESRLIPLSGFKLWISGPADVKVLLSPPWWTPERMRLLLVATLAILIVVLLWVLMMHREVARRGLKLAGEIAAGAEAKLKHESAMRERSRLAHDLHDTLEQELTGLSMQLQAAELFHQSEPERSRTHLALARRFLDRSREDVHRTVWDLHRFGLGNNTLVELLRKTAERLSEGGSTNILVEASGSEFPLPEVIAGNLLLLAQEAVTNALKHAKPGRIAIRVQFGGEGLTLKVTDDGIGFDPSSVPGHLQGHFGLQGIHERANRIGAEVSIRSSPGNGCAILVDLPSESLDFPVGD